MTTSTPITSPAADVERTHPRPEHPRPQMVRPTWQSLNGRWEFEIDPGDSGLERGLRTRALEGHITVPFCPESTASGLEHVDFMEAVWYRRAITTPASWAGQRILLHFGAVDHDATVWVDDVEVTRHRGGFSSFTADVTDVVTPGKPAVVVVRARDSRQGFQARGKQATWYSNTHCQYTRTTGIWQTVWLEAVPRHGVRSLKVTPDVAGSLLSVVVHLDGSQRGWTVQAHLLRDAGHGDEGTADDTVIATAEAAADLDLAPTLRLQVPSAELRLWRPGQPHLYGLVVEVHDQSGATVDTVTSYAGLRSVAIRGKSLLLNGERIFQRLVLDQGYYPESLMTAPTDEAMVKDIRLALAAGFNGARLHEKVFEERFLFHADRLGYLVWGEFGDWGVSGAGGPGHNQAPDASFVAQWVDVVERDFNHPSIIGWCPLNETHQDLHDRLTPLDDVTHAMYYATKAADPTRPVIDASGYSHRIRATDIYDSHSYVQDPATFRVQQAGLSRDEPFVDAPGKAWSVEYSGQPYFVSEYGGIWWNPEALDVSGQDEAESWGYGQRVTSEEDFHTRFAGLTDVLLDNPDMFGYCYTQLTDVFQEQNGIYRFDRSRKLDVERIAAVQQRTAAYEQRED